MKWSLFVIFFASSCVSGTSEDNNSSGPQDLQALNGCCTNFPTSPETPFWYRDIDDSARGDAKDLCQSTGGSWTNAACETSKVVGGCSYANIALPYIQLYPEAQFTQEEEVLRAQECPAGEGISWITDF